MSKVKVSDFDHMVETATEFATLDTLAQQAFAMAADMMNRVKRIEETKEAEEEKKEKEHEETN